MSTCNSRMLQDKLYKNVAGINGLVLKEKIPKMAMGH